MDRIYTHNSGAELWQGDRHDVIALLRKHSPKIHVIGLFAQEVQPEHDGPYEILRMGYDDNARAREKELEMIKAAADRASDHFSDRLRQGKTCLSSCNMGLNRSGLVSALTLMKVAGMNPGQAVATVRGARTAQNGMFSLCNPRFVDLLHSMADRVGSKTAYTEWTRKGASIT